MKAQRWLPWLQQFRPFSAVAAVAAVAMQHRHHRPHLPQVPRLSQPLSVAQLLLSAQSRLSQLLPQMPLLEGS